MKRLIILGARQHAKVIVAMVKECHGKEIEIVGYLDDNSALFNKKILGYPVLGSIKDITKIVKKLKVNCATIGISNRYMKVREKLYSAIQKLNLEIPKLIHSKAYISKFANVGKGVVINPGVVVNAFAKIGNNCVVYSNSTIEHETILKDNVYIGPGVNFSSNARVGKNTFVGAGAKIVPDIKIGSNVLIGAGSVVVRNVPAGITVAGIPARKIGYSSKSKI